MSDGPKLLSGGNPQIPKGDGPAPVQAYLDALPEWKGPAARRMHDIIVELVPDVQQAVRWNSPFYGIDGQGWFVSYHAMTRYMTVTFFAGTSLDPEPPETSKHESVRYYHVFEDDFDEAQFRRWVSQASSLPGEDLF